jgi:5-methylcytosine-specific restriction endonuclease McrA
MKLYSVITMVTPVTAITEDKSLEDEELVYAAEYLNVTGTPKRDHTKNLKARRLICRVCNFKFRTRQETQDHIRCNHRRRNTIS